MVQFIYDASQKASQRLILPRRILLFKSTLKLAASQKFIVDAVVEPL